LVLLLSETDIAGIVSMRDGVRIVEDALAGHYRDECDQALVRTNIDVPGDSGSFRVMSAVVPEMGFFGIKTLSGHPGHQHAGETHPAILLYSSDTGLLRAVIAGNRLAGIRTGAATGVAAKFLSRSDSRVLGIIGSGAQARYQVAALKEVRPLTEVRVFDTAVAKANTFAREIELDFEVAAHAVATAEEAVRGCDLVVTVTTSNTPVLDGRWLREGTHLSGVGSNAPHKRELDSTCFRRSTIFVDCKVRALQEAGDLQEALRTGAISIEAIDAELGGVITGAQAARGAAGDITLFKPVGMAVEDVAIAAFAYRQALAAGIGAYIELDDAGAVGLPSETLVRRSVLGFGIGRVPIVARHEAIR
jgi:ornithine cyclodeaminase/alanine dehydrogenase-like protein (mu-crystallin family)